jgi:hypothetical protein
MDACLTLGAHSSKFEEIYKAAGYFFDYPEAWLKSLVLFGFIKPEQDLTPTE